MNNITSDIIKDRDELIFIIKNQENLINYYRKCLGIKH